MEKRKLSMGVINVGNLESDSMCNNKTSSAYMLERDRFMKDLLQFHVQRGTPIIRFPRLHGKPLDLYELYSSVTKNGGWEKVTNEEKWFDIMSALQFNKSCGNADFALKQIYIKYLHHYERVHFLGQDADTREDQTETEDAFRKKPSNQVAGVVFTYNHQQHSLTDSTRENLGVARDPNIAFSINYASLEKSLSSGLPNEIDFAVNVCLLLSNDAKHILKGSKSLKVVELLLSHVGISKQGPTSFVWDFESDTRLNFLEFWNETVDNSDVKDLLCPESLLTEKVGDHGVRKDDKSIEIFNAGRHLGMKDREGQRVTQLIHIIRNFLVEDENLELMSSSSVLYRFLMLCSYNKYGCIKQLGLDALSFLCTKIILDPVDCRMTQLMLKTISKCVNSMDKFEVVRGCDMISQLTQSNEDVLCGELEEEIYVVLVRLLTLHDLQLVICSLEALYQLSEVGHVPCNIIANIHKAVDILLDLLTMDAQKQLIDLEAAISCDLPNGVTSPISINVPSTIVQPQVHIDPASSVPVTAINVTQAVASTNADPTNVFANVVVTTSKPDMPVVASKNSAVQANISASLIATFGENEKMAYNWLTAQYEFVAGSETCITKMEMYRRYISECSVHGLQKVVSPSSFENCIKAAFPCSTKTSRDNTTDFSFQGIVKKNAAMSKIGVNNTTPQGISQIIPQGVNNTTPVAEINNRKVSSTEDKRILTDKLLDGIDKELVSVAADVGIEIVSDVPPFAVSQSDCTTQKVSVPTSSLSFATQTATVISPQQIAIQQQTSTTSIQHQVVINPQLFNQQLVFQKISTPAQNELLATGHPINLQQSSSNALMLPSSVQLQTGTQPSQSSQQHLNKVGQQYSSANQQHTVVNQQIPSTNQQIPVVAQQLPSANQNATPAAQHHSIATNQLQSTVAQQFSAMNQQFQTVSQQMTTQISHLSSQQQLNASLINTVLSQQARFHPPTSNISPLQAQLFLKQVIDSQRMSEGKSLPGSPSSSGDANSKKRKLGSPVAISKPVKKKKGDVADLNLPMRYHCEWVGCEGLVFDKFTAVYQHVLKIHFEKQIGNGVIICMWSGCDGMPRQKWSFMAHMLERHLNENTLRLWSLKHLEAATVIPPHPPSTMYPPNAALQAIRRFSARPPFPELVDSKEETTSKHIHLTSALILRNLARYSSLARSLIKKHEGKLATIAFSDTESSCALSSCIYELHHTKN